MTVRNDISSRDRIGWRVSPGAVDYASAVAFMEQHAQQIARGNAAELVWLLEHSALYTAGTSAKPADLIDPQRFPVHTTGRGGQYTYHGPGQRIAYVMLDVKARGGDVRAFVQQLERWLIDALSLMGVRGEVRAGRVGIWVTGIDDLGRPREDKIAALGIRVSRGVSFHGVALNVSPDLSHFSGIVPCGIADHGVTSLAALGAKTDMNEVDAALRRSFEPVFGETYSVPDQPMELAAALPAK